MYIKKIILAIALLGVIALGIFSYYVYNSIFAPNTKFEQQTTNVYVKTDANYKEVIEQLRD